MGGLVLVAAVALCIFWLRGGVPDRVEPGDDASEPLTFPPTVAFVGDSYTGGSSMGGVGSAGYPRIVCAELDCHPYIFAVGGAGWWRKSEQRVTFGDMLPDICEALPQVVFVAGGANDADGPPTEVDAEIEKFFDGLKKCLPSDTRYAITSPFWRDTPIPEVKRLAAVLQDQADRRDWSYMNISSLFAGRLHKYIGADLTHPGDAGHRYVAGVIAQFLKPLVPDALTLAEIRDRELSRH